MPAEKNPRFQIWSEEPLNGEPPLDLLRGSLMTPADLFYVRCHGEVPRVEGKSYRLAVDGMVEHPLELRLEDLRQRFPARTVTAALNCAGNRRAQLGEVEEIPGETQWREGAIGNARWSGVPLREVLRAAGVDAEARHVAMLGLDEAAEGGESVRFGGSVPLAKAMSPETLLAYGMNGEPLPAVHGSPLRAIVPGYIGARSVKWLMRITAQREPSDNHFQARSYKLFPGNVRADEADWERGLALAEIAVNSAICRPASDERLEAGTIAIAGWAVAGGDRLVERVDLSHDGGRSWLEAELVGECARWGWRFWEATLELEPGRYELAARAWDSAATTQPESAAAIWNFKGYANNAWHRVSIVVE